MNVITASRQRWKIVLGGLMLTPGLYQLLIPAATNFAFTMFAVLCSLGALVFTAASVRCPTCRARWVWMAVSQQKHNAWVAWLMALEVCPSCGYGKLQPGPVDTTQNVA
jgi:hypothetical protein